MERDFLVPEADGLDQERALVDAALDPEAAVGDEPRIPDTLEANEADALEQSIDAAGDDDDYIEETE